MRVTILPERRTADVQAGTVADLLSTLELHQDAYLVVRSDQILTRDVPLAQDDEIEIWPVISGGGRR